MRVHRLEISAFGPFAATQSIDFADLNQAGLFLLTGPTGSGKTSVLDAICFALYGSVPGDRGAAKDLKSHHAGVDDEPVVELELTIRGRRLKVRRSPAWSKPSRRAKSGIADRPAQARLSEWTGDGWHPLSSRIDEVGHQLSALIGMSKDQFCQVVLLPQGKFQTFLSAGAKERHDVLEALFETGRFKRIEAWLAERRRACEAAVTEQHRRLLELLARIEEANDGPLAAASADSHGAAGVVVDQRTADALASVCSDLAAAIAAAREEFGSRQTSAKTAQHALDEARSLVDRQTRHREARLAIDELDSTADQLAARERQIELARSASTAMPLVELADHSLARLDRTRADRSALHASLVEAGVLDADSAESAPDAADRLRSQLAGVEALRPLAEEVASDEKRMLMLQSEQSDAEAALTATSDETAALGDPEQQHAAIATMTATAARRDVVAHVSTEAAASLVAARDADVLAPLSAKARADATAARGSALDAKERWLSARERHLGSVAAILAAGLLDGRACPVCGSDDHPAPAEPGSSHTGADDEEAALARHTEADDEAARAGEHAADLERRLAGARERAGALTVEAATAAVADAEADRLAVEEAAAALATAIECEARRQARLAELQRALASMTTGLAGLRARVDDTTSALAVKRRRLEKALGADETVETVVADLAVRLDACVALAAAERASGNAVEVAAEHGARLREALADGPFASGADVRAAALSESDIANGEALNRSARASRAAADRALSDPVLVEAALAAEPDLAALEALVESAQTLTIAEAGLLERLTVRLERLESLGARLQTELDAIEPLRRERDLAASVAAMCAGTSADNQTRTRLSHYVLSERLRQVIEAANARLVGIASGRYELLHTMDRGVGDTRGGLSLRVHDSHTGRSRDPATLSGGEGFFVSLALALGLADLVRDEIGGPELSTLFVDEGFGSLDAETLDEVMDELDSLRSGGRAVGIVSHLHELRLRVPAHVRVVPSPGGSSVLTA